MIVSWRKKRRKSQSLLNGALVLSVSTLLVKIIGVIYKIPISNMMGAVGRGYFDSAYNLYIPIYTISNGGSSRCCFKKWCRSTWLSADTEMCVIDFFRVSAMAVLRFTGISGHGAFFLIFCISFMLFIAKTNEVIPAIIAITPSIFFCCMMSIYRGYYNGLRNMNPTAISQVIEAIGKMIFGIAAAKLTITYGYSQFESGAKVFGKVCATESEAMSAIYPYAAAAAAVGVTMGTVIGMIYMIIMHKAKGDGITRTEIVNSPRPVNSGAIAKTLVAIAIPVVTSSIIFSLTNLIDAITIQNRLDGVISNNLDLIKSIYATQIAEAHVLDADLKDFLYGAYTLSLDFKNLIPSITTTLGVSAIPALSAAYAVKDKHALKSSVESVLRVGMIISLASGIGDGVLAEPILRMFYENGKSAPAISIAAPIVAAYGYTIFLMAISQPMTNMLQAVGKANVPVKSLTVGAVVKVVANYIFIGIPSININGAVIGTVLCYLIVVIYNYIALIKATKVKVNLMSVVVKPLISSVLCGVAAYCAYGIFYKILPQRLFHGYSFANITATLIAVVAAIIVYIISMLLIGGLAKDDIIMMPKGEKLPKKLDKIWIYRVKYKGRLIKNGG